MRTSYCETLYELMAEDKRIFALTADIGFRNFDAIIEDFPDRFINVGVAEANMISIAAGLALSGKIPFVFTIAPFVTMRCMEQIRIDLCYQRLPVKIIGAGGGFVYGPQGTTHHAIEEIGMLRTLPGITVVAPSDPLEVRKCVRSSMKLKGPIYIRIARNNEPIISVADNKFEFGRASILTQGEDASIITYGAIVKDVLEAAKILAGVNIHTRVINMHTLKPIDRDVILSSARETNAIISIEEHNTTGGVGSAIAEVLAETPGLQVPFKRMGVEDSFIKEPVEYNDLKRSLGMDAKSIAEVMLQLLDNNPKEISGLGNY